MRKSGVGDDSILDFRSTAGGRETGGEHLLKDEVGGSTNKSTETTGVAGEGNTNHDTLGESGHLVLAVFVLEVEDNGVGIGDHHEGGGGVTDPHGEEPCDEHDAEEKASGGLEALADEAGDTDVEVPSLHGEGHQETREEHEDGVVEVGSGDGGGAEDLEEGEEDDGEEGGDGEGEHLGEPEDGHQDEDGGASLDLDVIRVERDEEEGDGDDDTDDTNDTHGSAPEAVPLVGLGGSGEAFL